MLEDRWRFDFPERLFGVGFLTVIGPFVHKRECEAAKCAPNLLGRATLETIRLSSPVTRRERANARIRFAFVVCTDEEFRSTVVFEIYQMLDPVPVLAAIHDREEGDRESIPIHQ